MRGNSAETHAPDWPCRANLRTVPSSLGCSLVKISMNANRRPLDERIGDRLAAVLLKLGLVVEELELAGPAGHEEIDHALGPRGEMPRTSRERIGAAERAGPRPAIATARARPPRSPSRPLALQQRRQGHRPQPDTAVGEEVPASRSRKARTADRLASKSSIIAVPSSRPVTLIPARSFASHEFIDVQEHAGHRQPCRVQPDRRASRLGPEHGFRVSPARGSTGADPGKAGRHIAGDRGRSPAGAGRSMIRAASPRAISTKRRIVQERQGLERRVGTKSPGAGLHAAGRIEGRQKRVGRGPPEKRVEPAAIAVRRRYRPATGASSGPGSSRHRAGAERRSDRPRARQSRPLAPVRRRGSARRRDGAEPAASSNRLSGSTPAHRAARCDDWRYVAEQTIRRWIAFWLQPRSMSSQASQSSSSGWLGGVPCVPKSLSVSTRPRPK